MATNPHPLPAAPNYWPPQPPPTYLATLDSFLTEAIQDVRRHASEIESNGASEMSIGKGMVVPWVARRAALERLPRYPQVDDGYGTPYHGTSPPWWTGPPPHPPCNPHGNNQLVRALHQNG